MARLLAKDGLPEYVNSVLEEGVAPELKVFISTSFNNKYLIINFIHISKE